MVEEKQNKMLHDRDEKSIKTNEPEELISRREALKKAGKLAYVTPVLTVIPLSSGAQVGPPPSPPGGMQHPPEELRR
jgi:hypothetical protein